MKTNSETRLLVSSSVVSVVLGGIGTAVAVRSGSGSVLFDGLYSFVSAFMTLLSLPILRLVRRGGDERYNFGYAAFEPFYVIVSTIVIICAQVLVSVQAIAALRSGGTVVDLRGAMGYEIVSSVVCLAAAASMKLLGRRSVSPILRVEAKSWLVDGVLSLGVLTAFGLAVALERTSMSAWVPYVDPALTLALVLVMTPSLLKVLFQGVGELLSAAPSDEIQAEVERRLERFKGERGVSSMKIDIEKIGRSLNVRVRLTITRNPRALELERLRVAMTRSVRDYWAQGLTDFEFHVERPRGAARKRAAGLGSASRSAGIPLAI